MRAYVLKNTIKNILILKYEDLKTLTLTRHYSHLRSSNYKKV